MKTRIITVGVIKNERDQYLLCKMSESHGVYPGQWGLVGGGLEDNEELENGLAREIREETGLQTSKLTQLFFDTDKKNKLLRDGTEELQYLIFLNFEVLVAEGAVTLNDEWVEYAWVSADQLNLYDLNTKTQRTFSRYFAWLAAQKETHSEGVL